MDGRVLGSFVLLVEALNAAYQFLSHVSRKLGSHGEPHPFERAQFIGLTSAAAFWIGLFVIYTFVVLASSNRQGWLTTWISSRQGGGSIALVLLVYATLTIVYGVIQLTLGGLVSPILTANLAKASVIAVISGYWLWTRLDAERRARELEA